MKLPRTAKAQEIDIWEPKWISREILIPTYKIGDHNIIKFTKENAKKHYPDEYYVSGKDVRKYPIVPVPSKNGSSTRMYFVSIDELVVYEGRE